MNLDRQSIFLPVPGSLRYRAEIRINHVINPNSQFVVKSGGLENRMLGYELGALLGSSSSKRTGVMSCGE
jgi:hypothetical protein